MKRLAIIADNLIGANDAGVQFKKFGFRTQVVVDHFDLPQYSSNAEIISVNTNSRKITAEEAYSRVYQAGKILAEQDYKHFYKKIDSTLRGNIAEEIKAMLEALNIDIAVVTPSYPVYGRVTENGYLEIIPNWGESSAPVPICYIPSIIKSSPEMPVAVLTLYDIAEGGLTKKITNLANSGVKLIVADSVTVEDLDMIATAIAALDVSCLAVGSAGLAGSLSTVWAKSSLNAQNLRQGTMVISGTLNSITAEQITDALNFTGTELIILQSGCIYEKNVDEEVERVVLRIKSALAAGNIPIVVVDTLLENRDDVNALSLSAKVQEFGTLISNILGRIAQEIVEECHLDNLVISGGGTAISICRTLNIQKIELKKELLPGIPLGEVVGGSADKLHLVTKAGGFGRQFSIKKILELL